MSQPKEKQVELDTLLSGLLDGRLDDAEAVRLNDLLHGDPDACELYLNHMALHAHLKWEAGAPLQVKAPAAAAVAVDTRRRRSWPRYAAAALLLISIALAAVWTLRNGSGGSTGQPLAIATVEMLNTAQWQGKSLKLGHAVHPGSLSLLSGVAVLRFSNGAAMTITGPSELVLESARSVELRSGSVLVAAPPEATGFVVRTAAGRFIDLGTEFGVSVNADHSADVQVYEGVVIARPGANGLVIPVLASEAGRVDVDRGDLISIPFDAARFPATARPAALRSAPATQPGYAPLPASARIVFMGDRATDRETHLLLINKAFHEMLGTVRPALFNAGESLPLTYKEPELQESLLAFRPTHVVIEFGPQIALASQPPTPQRFEDNIARLLDRVRAEGIEPILATGFPVGPQHGEAQRTLDAYNLVLRRLATERGLRLADVERQFCLASRNGPTLVADNGTDPTFAGYRELAQSLLMAMGYPEAPIDTTLHPVLLPGVIRQWMYRAKPIQQQLDPRRAAAISPDATWMNLSIPQPDDKFLGRLADSSHSITYRDRSRGFATNLPRRSGEIIEAVAYLDSDKARDVCINTGATLRAVWLNGEMVFDRNGKWTGWHAGKERIPARLRAGKNTIIIEADTSFFLSITDQRDWPLP